MWINQKHFGDSSLLRDKDMSVLLRQDVLLFLYKDVVQKVPFFNNIGEKDDDRFLVRVCEELRPRIYLPGDFIIMEGTAGEEMYILSKGTVEVRSQAQDILLSTLKPGCFFGEISLILREKRTASIKAKTIAEVSVLTAMVRGGTGMRGRVSLWENGEFVTAPTTPGSQCHSRTHAASSFSCLLPHHACLLPCKQLHRSTTRHLAVVVTYI